MHVVIALLGFDMRLRDVLDYDVNDASRASESAATCKNACDVSRAASADCGVFYCLSVFLSFIINFFLFDILKFSFECV